MRNTISQLIFAGAILKIAAASAAEVRLSLGESFFDVLPPASIEVSDSTIKGIPDGTYQFAGTEYKVEIHSQRIVKHRMNITVDGQSNPIAFAKALRPGDKDGIFLTEGSFTYGGCDWTVNTELDADPVDPKRFDITLTYPTGLRTDCTYESLTRSYASIIRQ